MKKIIYAFYTIASFSILSAQNNEEAPSNSGKDPLEKTFITDNQKLNDANFQFQLRSSESWKNFANKASNWQVVFNESNQMPHRASGPAIKLPNVGDEMAILTYFSNTYLNDFNIPLQEMTLRSSTSNAKHRFYHFKQSHDGKEILNSDLYLKLTHQNDLVVFGLDVFKNIPTLNASIDLNTAKKFAQNAIKNITDVKATGIVKILPVPNQKNYTYYPVYEITVESMGEDNIPSQYYTLVNANDGSILYRQNMVMHHNHKDKPEGEKSKLNTQPLPSKSSLTMPGKVSATYYKLNAVQGSSLGSLGYVRISAQGQTFFADSAGQFNLPFSDASLSTNFSLNGLYSNTRIVNGSAPVMSTTLTQTFNNVTFGAPALINHLSAYNAVNRIHDYMKSKFPTFTTLDISLPTNIELTTGTCNAFYNGSSVNFYAPGGGCNSTANVADVVFHEYGHGINGQYYSTFGGSFNNGGMNEGYADVWALGLTELPVLGIGFFTSNTGFVRRYDVNKKKYPSDLVGEVHADGEIIAGSWWDYGVERGNVQVMMDLFKSTYPALLTAPNGQEGQLFSDILLEAVTEDDNDANLSNGTPNFCALIKAFGQHGIELFGSLNITASNINTTPNGTMVSANITNTNLGTKNIKAFYNTSNLTPSTYTQVTPSFAAGQLSFNITPALPTGSIVKYYYTTSDTCSANSPANYFPSEADHTSLYPNLPFMELIGYNLIDNDDFENSISDWDFFGANDNATTGIWDIDFPIGSFSDPAAQSGMVQTNNDHSTLSVFNGKCAITANASSATLGAGTADVDGGKTSLTSKFYDMTGLVDPTFSYWRWYTNDQGATPKTDLWRVQISNNFNTWITIEETQTPDHGWRRNIFKVSDYVVPNASVTIRFIAEDANAGSLVEAAVDDVQLFAANSFSSLTKLGNTSAVRMFPNPTKESVTISLSNDQKIKQIIITDQLGRTVEQVEVDDLNKTVVNTNKLGKGIYFVLIATSTTNYKQKLIIK